LKRRDASAPRWVIKVLDFSLATVVQSSSPGGGEPQIQLLLCHASFQTAERYLGTKPDLVHASNDAIRLSVRM